MMNFGIVGRFRKFDLFSDSISIVWINMNSVLNLIMLGVSRWFVVIV